MPKEYFIIYPSASRVEEEDWGKEQLFSSKPYSTLEEAQHEARSLTIRLRRKIIITETKIEYLISFTESRA